MTDDYRSERDRLLVANHLGDRGLGPVRMADIGYDIAERCECYLFLTSGWLRASGKSVFSVRMVHVPDDGPVGSAELDSAGSLSAAERSFREELVTQRNLLAMNNGRYREENGGGVPDGYEDVLNEILWAFQVGDYRIVEIGGRPAVEFSAYQCDPEYALGDYAAEYDGERSTYTVYLDDPRGTAGKPAAKPKAKAAPKASKPKAKAPAKKPASKPKAKTPSRKPASKPKSKGAGR